MAQEQTVQGAAKKISGLLNPKEGQSEPEKKEAVPSAIGFVRSVDKLQSKTPKWVLA